MIHVDFDPATLPPDRRAEWDAWMKKAERATRQLLKTWLENGTLTSDDFKSRVWRDLKGWLSEHVFYGKCAYCEKLIGDDVELDAEHYRPKAGIKYPDRAPVQVEDWNGTLVDHPGYFWLAYHWKNLLPSCKSCNQGRGKMNQFPVKDRRHAFLPKLDAAVCDRLRTDPDALGPDSLLDLLDPEALDAQEERHLLHPFFDTPRDHLGFGVAGVEFARTEHGQATIDALRLHRDTLRRFRKTYQEQAHRRYRSHFAEYVLEVQDEGPPITDPAVLKQEAAQKAWAAIEKFTNGTQPHTAAVIDYITFWET